jgi:formylglycine-generating enzyme required for sulfatase activity
VKRVFLRVGLLVAMLAAEAHARPLRPEQFWPGLGHPSTTAPMQGVVALKVEARGRVRIASGHFIMGSAPTDMMRAVVLCGRELLKARCDEIAPMFRAEGVAHEVLLGAFSIDKTEVTVADYRRCVSAGACAPPAITPGDLRFDRPEYPVTHVRWDDASAYCKWAGGRLPTEAEWEYAARGPTSREYPWGQLYNPRLCNHGSFAHDENDTTDGFAMLAPVGSFPDGATPLGLLDMAGNVAEWVEDVYELDEHGFGYSPKPQRAMGPDGKNVPMKKTGGPHVVRGGSYADGAPWMRSASRNVLSALRSSSVGFRCAAD